MSTETLVSPDQRLRNIQAELERRGVVDVKMTFAPGFRDIPLPQLKTDVANFLQAFLDGRCTPLTDLGDPPLPAALA